MTLRDEHGHPYIYCDSCRQPVNQQDEPGRFRHHTCPVPPLPPAAHAVLEQVRQLRADT